MPVSEIMFQIVAIGQTKPVRHEQYRARAQDGPQEMERN